MSDTKVLWTPYIVGPSQTMLLVPSVTVPTTWDPLNKGAGLSLSNFNTTVSVGAHAGYQSILSNNSKTSGKFHLEMNIGTPPQASPNVVFGICENDQNLNSVLTAQGNAACVNDAGAGFGSGIFSTPFVNLPTFTIGAGDTLAFEIDFTSGKLWVGYAASGAGSITWGAGANPDSGANPSCTWTAGPAIYAGYSVQTTLADATVTTIRPGAATQLYAPYSASYSRWDP